MAFSQSGRRIFVVAVLGIGATVGLGWAADPPKSPNANAAPPPADTFTPFVTSSTPPAQPLLTDKPATKSSRMMYEANWKNAQITDKPAIFAQGSRPFVWTVKNTGTTPVEFGDDYGFTLAPGEEEFIVDVRLVLQAKGDQAATVDVKASRVMSQNELIHQPQLTPVYGPTGGGAVPMYGEPFAPAYPSDPVVPSKKKFTNPL